MEYFRRFIGVQTENSYDENSRNRERIPKRSTLNYRDNEGEFSDSDNSTTENLQPNKIKWIFGENGDYVKGEWQKNQLKELISFEFIHPDSKKTIYVRKHRTEYLFIFDEEDFIAKVNFNNLKELRFSESLTLKNKRNILKKLKLIEIIRDEKLNVRNTAFEEFEEFLHTRKTQTADNLEYSEDVFQFCKNLESWNNLSEDSFVLENLIKDKNISDETKSRSQKLLKNTKALNERKKEFLQFDEFFKKNILTKLQEVCQDGIKHHRESLNNKYISLIHSKSPLMTDHLSQLNNEAIFYITSKDIEVFSDLLDIMDTQPFLDFVIDTWNNLFKDVRNISSHESVKRFAPLTPPIYFYLCKSFKEITLEINNKTEISLNELFKQNEQRKWILMENINWSTPSTLNHSLEKQYHSIFKLINYFMPGTGNKNRQMNPPQFLEFQQMESVFSNLFTSDELSSILQERLTWISIVNSATANLLSEGDSKIFEPIIQGYTNFIKNIQEAHYESFRIAAHDVIRFITQTIPFLSESALKIDRQILTNQIESIKTSFSEGQYDDFRDFVSVYNEYWEKRERILKTFPEKFQCGKFNQDMEKICEELLKIVTNALDKKVKSQVLIKFFRYFNEFLEDLNALEFNWYIKETNIDLFEDIVEIANGDKNSYKVIDSESFLTRYEGFLPKHYLIEIIEDLLNSIICLLNQNKWSDDENLDVASEMVSAIKKSFIYLKEQPNYLSFDIFKEESTQPFGALVENCNSFEDFKKRIAIIGDSFWYLRKQDEIDIETALELHRNENVNATSSGIGILKNCYHRYLEKFNSYIEESVNLDFEEKINFITEEVKNQSENIKTIELGQDFQFAQKALTKKCREEDVVFLIKKLLKKVEKNRFDKWNSEFRRKHLPDLLAGLAAVWSIQTSKDVASTGKSLKPHCIQILAILRLLSIDEEFEGVDKHLAQILTGQGKSVVLGLLSALLALMGHKVRTICYSKYLATRDKEDFDDFFKNFDVCKNVSYGTFENMANEIIEPEVNGKKERLRELVEHCILNHNANPIRQIKNEDISNTILLIDEVDVFFSEQFYGNTYNPCVILKFNALISIQEKIWEMASKNNEKNNIMNEVKEMLEKNVKENNKGFETFHEFLGKPKKYWLLKLENEKTIKKEYTNQTLYEEHLENMIDTAIKVANGSLDYWYINEYKINDEGIISNRDSNGIYSIASYCGYYNIFNYFRLKVKNFDHKCYQNYGYLYIDCGQISYAKLPEEYPLILGVSGTLTTLSEHEEEAIRESYNIRKKSIMPSFFGNSHLKFNSNENFKCKDSEEDWLNEIFGHANLKINSERSVLVFFDIDIEINKFKEKFFSKFDRLHVLTGNTVMNIRKRYVEEAGVAKTVTLATRGMGRGVDYKSSVTVETNGGVHVIQTFFSLDIKEETQIKGRTARKDNKGSYELIVCRNHLKKADFITEESYNINYASLNETRKQIMKKKGSNINQKIESSESNYKTTMDYLNSFFKGP